ncbi:MAG: glycosyl transferase [Actinomycetota bacterium]|nr:glycosyl transferase [Actinomycetota bacterium]
MAGLAAQDEPDFAVIISDQSDATVDWGHPAVAAMIRVLRAQGRAVRTSRHLPRRGMAEHRQYLLGLAVARRVLFLDNDVWLEPNSMNRMNEALQDLGCGFVGMAVQGLSHLADIRPDEQTAFEPWEGRVQPERIRRAEPSFQRWPLHNAANPAHMAASLKLGPDQWLAYRIAWVGGCVLFDRLALVACGGFDFWTLLPLDHSGEDVAAQWKVMDVCGGAAMLPSGAVHLESPTTVPERRVEAFDVVFPPDGSSPGKPSSDIPIRDSTHAAEHL